MFRPKEFTHDKIVKMDAKKLVQAWQIMSKEIREADSMHPDLKVSFLAPLSDFVQGLVSQMYQVGLRHLEAKETIDPSIRKCFKTSAEEAMKFLRQEATDGNLKVSIHIEKLKKEILPRLG